MQESLDQEALNRNSNFKKKNNRNKNNSGEPAIDRSISNKFQFAENLVYYSSRLNQRRNISRWSRYVVMYNDWRQRDDIEAVVSTADGTLTGSAWPRESTCVFVPVPFKHQRRRLRYVIQLLTSCSCFPRNIDHDNRCALIDPLPIDRWIAQCIHRAYQS